jgi:hypothetical protein
MIAGAGVNPLGVGYRRCLDDECKREDSYSYSQSGPLL